MQFGGGTAQGDAGTQFLEAGVFEVILGEEHKAAGRETGVVARLLLLVLLQRQEGGLFGDPNGLNVGQFK